MQVLADRYSKYRINSIMSRIFQTNSTKYCTNTLSLLPPSWEMHFPFMYCCAKNCPSGSPKLLLIDRFIDTRFNCQHCCYSELHHHLSDFKAARGAYWLKTRCDIWPTCTQLPVQEVMPVFNLWLTVVIETLLWLPSVWFYHGYYV